jgi:hypothetical protein
MDNFYGEFEQVFDHFPTYHKQILLGCCKAKYGREDRFKLTAGRYHIVWIHQTLKKMREYKGTVHQLFIYFNKNLWFIRGNVLNNIFIEFGINIKLFN